MAYTANHKQPVVPYGNLIPSIEHSGSDRPHSDIAAAEWLPLEMTATNTDMGFFSYLDGRRNDYMVMMPGKLVALTREPLSIRQMVGEGPVGRGVPAGVKISWAAAGGSDDILEYTALDVTYGTTDLTTGVAVTAAVAYDKDAVELALASRGLLFDGESAEDFISRPVGITPFAVHAWAGGDGLQPSGYNFHNYKREHKTQILCDLVVRLPRVPVDSVTIDADDYDAAGLGGDGPTVLTNLSRRSELQDGDPGFLADPWLSGANFATYFGDRYKDGITNTEFVVLGLGYRHIALPSFLHSITVTADGGGADKTATVLARKRSHINSLSAEGDYFVDPGLGVIAFYVAGGNSLPATMAVNDDFTFDAHSSAAELVTEDGSDSPTLNPPSVYSAVKGQVKPGDFLVCDRYSDFRAYVPKPAATVVDTTGDVAFDATVLDDLFIETWATDPSGTYDLPEDIVGQVLTLQRYPREDMAKRRTFHDNLPTGVLDKMPGSATDGFSDMITYSNGDEYEVIVNLINR
jgi:hypothetical protein